MQNPHAGDKDVIHAPHAPLTDYYPTESARRGWVADMFNSTAPDYNRIEKILGFGSGPWYRRQALLRAGLRPGMLALDVGVGTGLVAQQAVAILGDPTAVTGVDPSPGMLQNTVLPAGVRLVEGRAEALPFPDSSVDFLSMGYALRHISDLSVAFAEFHRVLKPGGRLCILEITCPDHPVQKALLKTYARYLVPLMARMASRSGNTSVLWRYYWDTIEACAPPEEVVRTLQKAGFDNAGRHLELGMFSEYQAVKA